MAIRLHLEPAIYKNVSHSFYVVRSLLIHTRWQTLYLEEKGSCMSFHYKRHGPKPQQLWEIQRNKGSQQTTRVHKVSLFQMVQQRAETDKIKVLNSPGWGGQGIKLLNYLFQKTLIHTIWKLPNCSMPMVEVTDQQTLSLCKSSNLQ